MKKILLILIYSPFIGFGKNSISMKKILLILLLLPIIGHTQGVKNIHSISDARMPLLDHGYTLDGQMMNMSSANKVLSADNFGPTGTYPQSFSIISGYSTSNSLAAITSNSNIDLFFFGGFDKNNPSLIPFTNAELDSLHKWSMNGGKMIIGASANSSAQNNSILNAKWDFDLIEDPNAVIVPSSAGLSSSIFDGPFGYNLNSLQNMWVNQGGSIRGYFNIIPSNSIVLAEDWIGNPTLILDCKTLDLIVADCDAYTTLGGISNGPLISTRNDTFWANTIVYMDMLQSQPVISLSGNMLSTTALYSSYQWFKDSIAILGANSSSHNTLGQVGSYHVEANLDCGCNNVASNSIIIGAVDGCTDPAACNYDSGANTDDGSCIYPSLSTTTITNCDSYTWSVNGAAYTTSGTYTDISANSSGCTHTETLVLTINNGTSNSTTITDCDSYTSSVNGTAYITSGTYTDISTNSSGCTHTEALVLTINNSTSNTTTITDCDSYTWSVNGTNYTTSGTYTDVSANSSGCTHTETLVLIIDNSISLTNTVSICFGESITVGSNTYSQTGTYTDVFNAVNGCDSIITTNLNVSQQIAVIISQVGMDIKTNSTGGSMPYVYEWNTGETSQIITPNQDGSYWVIVTDANGCLSDTSFFVVDWMHTSIEYFNIDRLSVYPNPSREIFNIEFTSSSKQSLVVRVVNILGEYVLEDILEDFKGEYNKQVDLATYTKGVYFLEIETTDGVINKKLILQ